MNGLPTADVGVPLIVITFPDQEALTPTGNPFAPSTPLFEMPVAIAVAYVIFVIAEPKQIDCAFVPTAEVNVPPQDGVHTGVVR